MNRSFTREFSMDYLDREHEVQDFMRKYALRNKIHVRDTMDGDRPVVQFTARSRHQMLIFGIKVTQRFEFFEFW